MLKLLRRPKVGKVIDLITKRWPQLVRYGERIDQCSVDIEGHRRWHIELSFRAGEA